MDLLKALDVLSTVSIEKPGNEDDTESRKIKISACKVVVEQLSTPSLKSSNDFPRFLSVGSASLIRMHGDDDINVRAAAEECLNRIIFVSKLNDCIHKSRNLLILIQKEYYLNYTK